MSACSWYLMSLLLHFGSAQSPTDWLVVITTEEQNSLLPTRLGTCAYRTHTLLRARAQLCRRKAKRLTAICGQGVPHGVWQEEEPQERVGARQCPLHPGPSLVGPSLLGLLAVNFANIFLKPQMAQKTILTAQVRKRKSHNIKGKFWWQKHIQLRDAVKLAVCSLPDASCHAFVGPQCCSSQFFLRTPFGNQIAYSLSVGLIKQHN